MGGSACEAWVIEGPSPPGNLLHRSYSLGWGCAPQGVWRFLRRQERSVQGLRQTLSQDTMGRDWRDPCASPAEEGALGDTGRWPHSISSRV